MDDMEKVIPLFNHDPEAVISTHGHKLTLNLYGVSREAISNALLSLGLVFMSNKQSSNSISAESRYSYIYTYEEPA